MAKATDQQVQQYVNERVRPRAEQMRSVLLSMEDDKSAIDDVYEALADNPTWTDDRSDAPPHLLTPSDVIAWNSFVSDVITAMRTSPHLPIVLKACVRAI